MSYSGDWSSYVSSYPYNKGGGSGTESDPYIIERAERLYNFLKATQGRTTAIYGKLSADIDLDGHYWTPMSVSAMSLDGNGKSIKNMCITSTKDAAAAFISGVYKASAVINNVVFENASVSVKNADVGIICGSNNNNYKLTLQNVTVRNSSVSMSATLTSNRASTAILHYYVGAIVGYASGVASSVNLYECEVYNTSVTASYTSTHGTYYAIHLGGVFGGGTVNITNCNFHLSKIDIGTTFPTNCRGYIAPIGHGGAGSSTWQSSQSNVVGNTGTGITCLCSISIDNYVLPTNSLSYSYDLFGTTATSAISSNSNAHIAINKMITTSTSLPSNFSAKASGDSSATAVCYVDSASYVSSIFRTAMSGLQGYKAIATAARDSEWFQQLSTTKAYARKKQCCQWSTADKAWGDNICNNPYGIGPYNPDTPSGISQAAVTYVLLLTDCDDCSSFQKQIYDGSSTYYYALFPNNEVELPVGASVIGSGNLYGIDYGSASNSTDNIVISNAKSGTVISNPPQGYLWWDVVNETSIKGFKHQKDSSTIADITDIKYQSATSTIKTVIEPYYMSSNSTII